MSLRALFRFPDPVNEVSARIVAGGVVVLAATILGSRQEWLVVALAYGFVARVATGPTLSPLGLAATKLITPRLGLAPRYSPGPAKRFAQAIGAVFSVSAAVLALGFGLDTAAFVLVAVLGLFAFLEAAFGLCVGCKVFALLIRTGLVPEAVCRTCADLWAR
jgi:Domain of unknown function (DUF4395)